MAYDIFISYRRKGAGAGVAGELQTKFENRGYKVFLDVDNIGSGDFPLQIDQAIQGCNDFLIILSPGMLDRCADEEDWVRHEIVLAEKYGKNIIGVSLPGFVMPEPNQLPEPIRKIPEKQVFLWSHEYRNASLNKVEENLVSSVQKKKRSRKMVIGIAAGVVVLAVASWFLIPRPTGDPHNDQVAIMSEGAPQIDISRSVRDTFALCVNTGDELLVEVPNPTEESEFHRFMVAMANYEKALSLVRRYPEFQLDTFGLTKKYDSLNNLREERLDRELDAASKFASVDQMEFASYRFDNAKALAKEEDHDRLEAVGRRIKQ